jgi:hypothetical protein
MTDMSVWIRLWRSRGNRRLKKAATQKKLIKEFTMTLDEKEEYEKEKVTIKYRGESIDKYCNKITREKIVKHLQHARKLLTSAMKSHDKIVIDYKSLVDRSSKDLEGLRKTFRIDPDYKKTLEHHLKFDLKDERDVLDVYYDDLLEIGKAITLISDGLSGHVVLSDIAENYRAPKKYLNLKTKQEDWEKWQYTEGYVARKNAGTAAEVRKSIHIRFSSVAGSQSKTKTAQIILHEAAHKFAKARDEGYANTTAYNTLDVNKSMRNADSISFYVVSLAMKAFIDADYIAKHTFESDCHVM